jgi:pyruvyltransferase
VHLRADRDDLRGAREARDLTVVPNLNDLAAYPAGTAVLDPRKPLDECLGVIAASAFVTGSSLHAIVIAESLGIPARLIASGAEPPFKYDDYYFGSGRPGFRLATSVDEAVAMGGEPAPNWSSGPLLDAFPSDLWTGCRMGS